MYSQTHKKKGSTQYSSSTPVPNPFQRRPFGVEAKFEQSKSQSMTMEELEAQYEKAKQRDFSVNNISTYAPGREPPEPVLQARLIIRKPGDNYIQETNMVAAQVVQGVNAPETPPHGIQRKQLPSSKNKIQRMCSECAKEEEQQGVVQQNGTEIQRKMNQNFVEQTDLVQKIVPLKSQIVQRQIGNATCHGTNRRAGIEHQRIQQDYITTKDSTGVREYSIPGSSASGRVGYADIVGLGTHAIYEIKPYTSNNITEGLIQVNRYLQAAQRNCDPNASWHLGFAYPDTVLPLGPNRELVAKQYNQPGLILYYTRNRNRRRVPEPVPERERERGRERVTEPVTTPAINWENVFQLVIGLGLSIATVGVILYALLSPEPASKLAAAGLSTTMITMILVHFGIEDSDNQS